MPSPATSPWARVVAPSLILASVGLALAGPARAQTVFIDFEQLASAPCNFVQTAPLREEFATLGLHFTGPGPLDGGAVLDTCGNFQVQPHSGVKFLAFNSGVTWSGGGKPIDPENISFDQRATSVDIWVASGNASATFRIDAFDGPTMVGTNMLTTGTSWALLSVSVPGGFTRVVLDASPTVFLMDDLTVTMGTNAVSYCHGDGTAAACPCGNAGTAGNGCASSVSANGARIAASGIASVGADTVVLTGSAMPNSSALYFQGTQRLSGGAGLAFGDGLRCVAGTIIRLGTKTNAAGTSAYPIGGDVAISVKGAVSAGDVRQYQIWYRNAAAFCTASTFNLTNGLEVTWSP